MADERYARAQHAGRLDMVRIARMPWLHLFASPACNLRCEYCSQGSVRKARVSDDFLQDKALLTAVDKMPPTHFYLSGGEPFIHPGVKDFVRHAGRKGHVISFDTNFTLPLSTLEKLFDVFDPNSVGFVNISHHIVSGVSLPYMLERAEMLRKRGIPFFIKYVGVPEHLAAIAQNMRILRSEKIGAMATLVQAQWHGRTLPAEYTDDEILALIDLVTLKTHGMQIFDGFRLKGTPCRAGNDFIAWNMHGDRKIIACCHTSATPVQLRQTIFGGAPLRRAVCTGESCLGDLMFICGINGLADETQRFGRLCAGEWDFAGRREVVSFIRSIIEQGVTLVNEARFREIEKKVNGEIVSFCGGADADEKFIGAINNYTGGFKTVEGVIAANPGIGDRLRREAEKLSHLPEPLLARAVAKKVVQERFDLPAKANIEVIATCILKCGFCVLADLHRYRRKTRMGIADFLRIWKYLEPYTGEVEFTGGEPLLNTDIFAMIGETNKTGVVSTLTTNAQLLTSRNRDKLLENPPSRLLIAYDGVIAKTYERTRIGASLRALRANVAALIREKKARGLERPHVCLQMVITRKNKAQIERFWREAYELGADSAVIKPVLVWPGNGEAHERKMVKEFIIPDSPLSYHRLDGHGALRKERRPGFCPNARHVHIGAGSEVIPCWYVLKNSYVAGYCADMPFHRIWFSREYQDYRRKMVHEEVMAGCKGCIGRYDPKVFVTKTRQQLADEIARVTVREKDCPVPVVTVDRLHEKLGFGVPLDYPEESYRKDFREWRMETDDAPIFRYLYRHANPRRHLEFGTWQGAGAVLCLEESSAHVWTVNPPFGEDTRNGNNVYGHYDAELPSIRWWAEKLGMATRDSYRTDSLGFIGRKYLERGLGNRVCQIYADSMVWDPGVYPDGFFDSVLIDGGHAKQVVINDTEKAFRLVRKGGLILWHDFCPPLYAQSEAVLGVMDAVTEKLSMIKRRTSRLFWIYPSCILAGVVKG